MATTINNETQQQQPICVGSINDAGILLALKRKGITLEKSLSELFANSIDAGCNQILYKILRNSIKIIDDGKGMNMEAIKSMFDLHKENHKNDKSLGVSGVGGKVSILILSDDTVVVIYTKSATGQYYKVEVPWDEMLQKGKYTGMIRPVPMNESEVAEFHKERETMKNKNTGVTIKFKYSDKLKHEIEKQFCGVEEYRQKYNSELNPENQLGVIYGAFPLDCSYEHYEEKEPRKMQKYNYFGGEDNEFYKGKTEATISVYEKEKKLTRYILYKNGEPFEIKQLGVNGTSCKKEIEKMTESLIGWSHSGDFELKVGCRRDDSYFNDESSETKEMPDSGAEVHLKYEQAYFGDCKDVKDAKLRDYFCKPELKRNDQVICSFDLPDELIGARRANAKSMFTIKHVKSQLLYYPVSSLNNPLDLLCGIQENKGQCACPFDKSFSRLIYTIKNEKATEIWDYFNEIVETNIEKENEEERKNREREEEAKRKVREVQALIREEKRKLAAEKRRDKLEREAKEEAERKAKEEAERKAREEVTRKAREDAERRAQEEELKNATPEARAEKQRIATEKREEAERKAKEEAERKAKEEAERKAKEEAERKAKEEAEMAKNNAFILKFTQFVNENDAETLKQKLISKKNAEELRNRFNQILELFN
jgi:hypothetical protein